MTKMQAQTRMCHWILHVLFMFIHDAVDRPDLCYKITITIFDVFHEKQIIFFHVSSNLNNSFVSH